MPAQDKVHPTITEKRLEAIELAISQLAHAARTGFGWKPEAEGQTTLATIVRDAQDRHALREAGEVA